MSNSKLFTVRVNPDTDAQQAENLPVLMEWKENGELKDRIMDAISHYIDSPYYDAAVQAAMDDYRLVRRATEDAMSSRLSDRSSEAIHMQVRRAIDSAVAGLSQDVAAQVVAQLDSAGIVVPEQYQSMVEQGHRQQPKERGQVDKALSKFFGQFAHQRVEDIEVDDDSDE